MITSDHPCDPASINDKLERKLIFPGVDRVDDELYDYLHQINYDKIYLYQNYSYQEVGNMVSRIKNQYKWHI